MNSFLRFHFLSRLVFVFSILSPFCIFVYATAQLVQADDRPNFVLIIADDVSADDLSCFGRKNIQTPNLQQLAEAGICFDRAFVTCSSCSPSRVSLITGLFPHQTGAPNLHDPLPADQRTFVEDLKRSGYWTAAAGKWHLGGPTKSKFDLVNEGGGASGCERWLATMKAAPKEKPLFLWFAAFDAHRDYEPNVIAKPHTRDDVTVPPYLPDHPTVRDDFALYYDEICRLDSYVGKVREELKNQGRLENTIILFLADNGCAFPRCKTTLYDSGIRTPLIISCPEKFAKNARSGALVSTVDIAPTILELAGVDASSKFTGHSFASILKGEKESIQEEIYAERNWHDYKSYARTVRTTRYKYIRNWVPELPNTPPADGVRSPTFQLMRELRDAKMLNAEQLDCFVTPRAAEELYDLEEDPFELHNIAEREDVQGIKRDLSSKLDHWRSETSDVTPTPLREDKYDRETGK